jgi:hypothetical protein
VGVVAPDEYVAWVNAHVGFNPRGQAHSDVLSAAIIRDLRVQCGPLGAALDAGALEFRPNVGMDGRKHLTPTVDDDDDEDAEIDSNIDGVVIRSDGLFAPATASTRVPLTIENKTIMTAHGKARKNRFGDARAYANHAHQGSPETVAGFTIVINTAPAYRNPDAFARTALSSGTNTRAAAQTTIDLFRQMRIRTDPTQNVGRCEAVYILAINYDGVNPTARLVTEPPAPRPGDPFSYEWFLDRMCTEYVKRNT